MCPVLSFPSVRTGRAGSGDLHASRPEVFDAKTLRDSFLRLGCQRPAIFDCASIFSPTIRWRSRALGSLSACARLRNLEEPKMRVLRVIADSESWQPAVQMVIEQARPADTEVRVLYVRQPPTLLVAREMVGYPQLEIPWEMQSEAAERMVRNV